MRVRTAAARAIGAAPDRRAARALTSAGERP
ncbi:hypothetical protein J2S55_000804 [Streptosporangium brasiliense]|uniref:Uncharacterized protein n=1 Tax=Streptosporangium brasiliense TaxID=47480 RepID=A0ABT9QZB7_9ACTN|nr:hypothetical protein [Streptosporangium brasiliense]